MSVFLRNGARALELAAAPSTPAAGARLIYPKSDGWYEKNSAGVETKISPTGTKVSALTAVTTPAGTDEFPVNQGGTTKKMTLSQINVYADPLRTASTTAQGPGFAADTYVTGSGVTIPQARMVAGVEYRCRIVITKTAASTAIPAYALRYGTAGSTADTARASFTQTSAQTAVADTAILEFFVTFRVVGASAVVAATVRLSKDQNAIGFGSRPGYVQNVISSTFDSTPAGSIMGVSLNGGTASAWTVQQVLTELAGLT